MEGSHRFAFLGVAWGLLHVCLASPAFADRVIYVHAGASGANDGMSWAGAYTDLQDALAQADEPGTCTEEDPCQIWVAAGVYNPDRGTGDREASFDLLNYVGLYGGFAGWETDLEQRDWVSNETVLTGDLSGDDDPDFEPESNCCIENIEQPGCDNEECLELVLAIDSSCAFAWYDHCANWANVLCCELCREGRCENTYQVLTADGTGSSAVLDGFTVTAGEANGEQFATGGGLYSREADLAVANCVFAGNAAFRGTAVYVQAGDPDLRACTFRENVGFTTLAYAMMATGFSEPALTDCSFIGNRGGGLQIGESSRITRCDFIRNTGRGLTIDWGAAPVLIDCNFIGNTSGTGAGIKSSGFPLLINCAFIENSAGSRGGGMSTMSAILVNCMFRGNSALTSNGLGTGGAIGHDLLGTVWLSNCTIVGNSADSVGGAVLYSAVVDNCIFRGNRSGNGEGEWVQVFDAAGSMSINYSCVQGWTGTYGGVGNFGDDPLFVQEGYWDDPGTPDDFFDDVWVDGDYHVLPDSPSINTGNPDTYYIVDYDLDDHTRVLCGTVDMGVYEFGIGDFDCDRIADLLDFGAWQDCMTGPVATPPDPPYSPGCEAFDFNANQQITLTDLAGFQNALTAP